MGYFLNMTNADLENKQEELVAEGVKIKDELLRRASLSPAAGLAEELHRIQCHWDHTEGCGWYYEKNWDGWTHKRYLEKAQTLLKEVSADPQEVIRIVRLIK